MTTAVQLYFLGNDCQPPENLSELSNLKCEILENKKFENLRLTDLISLFEKSTSEYVGFVDDQLILNQELLSQLNGLDLITDQARIYLLPFGHSKQFTHSIQNLPPIAAILAMNPFQHAIVLMQKSAFLNLNNMSDSTDLLWHSLILMTQVGIQNQLIKPLTQTHTINSQISLPQLTPNYPSHDREWLLQILQAYEPVQDLTTLLSQPDATALKAGLFCIHDYLDESHAFSQSVQNEGLNRAGDYWHYIMHRREPDYSNAKYWSRAVGKHPLLDILPEFARPLFDQFQSESLAYWKNKLLENKHWSLNTFVDFCAECETTKDEQLDKLAQYIQWIEMQLLLQQTSLDAVTG